MLRHIIVPALVAAGAGGGCFDLVHLEARAAEVCLTGVRIDVPGAPAGIGAPERVEISHAQQNPAADLPAELDARAELTGVAVTAAYGIDDFGFLRGVRIGVAADDLPPVAVAEIDEEQSAMLAGLDRWFFAAGSEIDLIDYFLADELVFDIALEGEMPETDWAVELEVCAAGAARYAAGL